MASRIILITLFFISSHVLANDLTLVYQSASSTPLDNPAINKAFSFKLLPGSSN